MLDQWVSKYTYGKKSLNSHLNICGLSKNLKIKYLLRFLYSRLLIIQ